MSLEHPARPKARSPGSRGTTPCASYEAHRRMAAFSLHQTGNRTSPASREARCRAAVKPRPSRMSPEHPARPKARSPGSRGTTPCASHEAHRRMAAFSLHQTGNHTSPASREACRRAAVKPRPTVMSPEHPARQRRAVRGAGRREEARAQWAQPPQAVSDRQPSTETRIWHGSAKDDD